MIQPLTKLLIDISAFGGQLDLSWKLPDELPENFKIYLFQRSKIDITQNEIDQYFSCIANLSNYNYNGLMVFDRLSNKINVISIYQVRNDIQHFYKAVIRDEDTGEYSATISANAIPRTDIIEDIPDTKDMVIKALKKMFDTVKSIDNQKVREGKDIDIVKQFQTGEIEGSIIMIERVNGAVYQKYLGNQTQMYGSKITFGDIDNDIIRATYLTIAGADRRELMSRLFKSRRVFLKKMIKAQGAIDCEVTVEGDYFNPMFHGDRALGVSIIFSIYAENKFTISNEEIESHITEMKVLENG